MYTYGVVSCPPPWVPVLKKMPAGLPARLCSLHKPPVASKKAFICAAIMPNLVGNPNRIPSASASSCGVMTGMSGLGGAPIFPSTSSDRVSGTYQMKSRNKNIVVSANNEPNWHSWSVKTPDPFRSFLVLRHFIQSSAIFFHYKTLCL